MSKMEGSGVPASAHVTINHLGNVTKVVSQQPEGGEPRALTAALIATLESDAFESLLKHNLKEIAGGAVIPPALPLARKLIARLYGEFIQISYPSSL